MRMKVYGYIGVTFDHFCTTIWNSIGNLFPISLIWLYRLCWACTFQKTHVGDSCSLWWTHSSLLWCYALLMWNWHEFIFISFLTYAQWPVALLCFVFILALFTLHIPLPFGGFPPGVGYFHRILLNFQWVAHPPDKTNRSNKKKVFYCWKALGL